MIEFVKTAPRGDLGIVHTGFGGDVRVSIHQSDRSGEDSFYIMMPVPETVKDFPFSKSLASYSANIIYMPMGILLAKESPDERKESITNLVTDLMRAQGRVPGKGDARDFDDIVSSINDALSEFIKGGEK